LGTGAIWFVLSSYRLFSHELFYAGTGRWYAQSRLDTCHHQTVIADAAAAAVTVRSLGEEAFLVGCRLCWAMQTCCHQSRSAFSAGGTHHRSDGIL
jgi:hypothetical protein